MFTLIMQFICICLFAIGCFILLIQIKTNLHLSFITFGANITLLCIFSGIDLWFEPMLHGTRLTILQHIIISIFVPLLLIHIGLLFVKAGADIFHKPVKFFLVISDFIIILFASGNMIRGGGDRMVLPALYHSLFLPYFMCFIITITFLLYRYIEQTTGKQKKFLLYQLIGLAFLSIGGGLDLSRLLLGRKFLLRILSFSLFSVTIFCSIMVYAFIDTLIRILNERVKLHTAYNHLHEAHSLTTLDTSTTIINHDLRNFIFKMQSYIHNARQSDNLSMEMKMSLAKMSETLESIHGVSTGIAELSKPKLFDTLSEH